MAAAELFEVVAEPNRRRILDLLLAREQPVGDLVRELSVSQPAVSKHLRVLRDAGLVDVRTDGQRRLYRVRAAPLNAIDEWLAPYRALWTASLDDLDEIYRRLHDKGVPVRVSDHTVSLGVYFSDPDGNGLEVYYELPRNQWQQDRPFSGGGAKGRFPGPWDEALRQQQAPAPALTNV